MLRIYSNIPYTLINFVKMVFYKQKVYRQNAEY
uniref:Uncharacterized protein n=1 Tax=Rhizophora mucronata TaxID=61149 RepID=A0A2P2QLI6_RHIMU